MGRDLFVESRKTMLTLNFFLLVCTFGKLNCAGNGSSIKGHLPDVLSYLCPGVDVCGKIHDKYGTVGTCCTDCSCEPDCESSSNCCYPSTFKYTADNIKFTSRYRYECLYPTTYQLTEEEQLLYQPYFMITSVPGNPKCGDTSVALWGSFFPVYSASQNKIYKNINCALADKATDGIVFDSFLTCKTQATNLNLYSERHFLNIESNTDNGNWNNCHINFMVEKYNIKSFKCYIDVVDTCPVSELIIIPEKINLSAEEIIDACSSGLFSAFREGKMYANVFRFICNNPYMYGQDMFCETVSPDIILHGGGEYETSFYGLIDQYSFLKEEFKSDSAKQTKTRTVCSNQDKTDCRAIHCPLGQLFDRQGNCKHSISIWREQLFYLYVNLTSEDYVDVNTIQQGLFTKVLNSPWPDRWFIRYFINKIVTRVNMNYTHLVINLEKKAAQYTNITSIMKTIRKYIRRTWTLKDGNKTYIFESDIATWDYSSRNLGKHDFIYIENRKHFINLPSQVSVYSSQAMMGFFGQKFSVPKLITRMDFCNQIELNSSEFILSKYKAALFNIQTQRIMFYNHEFELIVYNEFQNERVRVCIEDSGLFKDTKVSNSKTNKALVVNVILAGIANLRIRH